MKVILASNNANKLREMQQILSPLGWEILRQKNVGLHLEPDENGETFEENSLIKAEAVMKASGLPAIADDPLPRPAPSSARAGVGTRPYRAPNALWA